LKKIAMQNNYAPLLCQKVLCQKVRNNGQT